MFLYKKFFGIRQYETSCNINTAHIPENIQNKIYNLQVILEQFTDQKKIYRLVGIDF